MKKFYVLFLIVFALALAAGCASKSSLPSNSPAWMAENPPSDVIWGIGFAKLHNHALGMDTAVTRAQRDAASQISALVQAMLTDYANESGIASNPRSMIAIENIGKNIVNLQLNSTVERRDDLNGTWWVRVAVLKSDAKRQLDSLVNNEAADYAEFRAAQAIQRLNFEIDRASLKGVGTGAN